MMFPAAFESPAKGWSIYWSVGSSTTATLCYRWLPCRRRAAARRQWQHDMPPQIPVCRRHRLFEPSALYRCAHTRRSSGGGSSLDVGAACGGGALQWRPIMVVYLLGHCLRLNVNPNRAIGHHLNRAGAVLLRRADCSTNVSLTG